MRPEEDGPFTFYILLFFIKYSSKIPADNLWYKALDRVKRGKGLQRSHQRQQSRNRLIGHEQSEEKGDDTHHINECSVFVHSHDLFFVQQNTDEEHQEGQEDRLYSQ